MFINSRVTLQSVINYKYITQLSQFSQGGCTTFEVEYENKDFDQPIF